MVVRRGTLTLLLSVLFSCASLQAGTIGPSCGSCFGGTYTLTNLGLVTSTATTQTFQISYVIDSTGYTGSSTNYIQQVAVKVASSVTGASLVSAPAGIGFWNVSLNNISNNGCTGGGSGWVCADDGNHAPVGAVYTWIFNIQVPTGTLFTGTNQASIQANYNPPMGLIVSEDITLGPPRQVPEPTSGALSLLVGGLGVWCWSRYRSRARV